MRTKLLIIFLGVGTTLLGAGFTIETGETVDTTQTMGSNGDVGIIENGGTINVTAEGVGMDANSQTLSNAGAIITTVDNNEGVDSLGNFNKITNSGVIATNGTTATGISSQGNSCLIDNSGTISTVGNSSPTIFSNGNLTQISNSGVLSTLGIESTLISSVGDSVRITNSGLISTNTTNMGINSDGNSCQIQNSGTISITGDTSTGLNIDGASNQVINGGLISMAGVDAIGITVNGASNHVVNDGRIVLTGNETIGISSPETLAVIINNGTISTVGADCQAISSEGSSAYILNYGVISAAGTDALGVSMDGASSRLINSGTIVVSGDGARALSVTGANASVVNSGTIRSAQGTAIGFSGANPTLSLRLGSNIQGVVSTVQALNVDVEEGLNLRLTIEEVNGFGTLNIGSPFVTIGNTETLAVADRTGFTMQADVLEDLSDSVLDSIYRGKYDYLHCQDLHCGVWAEAIGSYRTRRQTVYYNNWEAGGLAGVNWEAYCCGTLGMFAGGTYGEATVGQNTQRAEVSTVLAGLTYEQMYQHLFLGFAITGGYVGWENRRTVMYNLAPGGVEEAIVDINGWMISPELTASGWLGLSRKWSLLATGTLRYAGLFLGDYDESGSSANLSINSRQVDLLKVMGELALSSVGEGWNFEPYLGIAGRFQLGGRKVDSQLLGESLTFGAGSPYNLVEVLYGIRGQESMGRYTLYGNIEGLVDNYDGARVLGELGVRYLF